MGWMPDSLQTDLLIAALSLRPQAAATAWDRWRAQARIDHVDGSTFRLFPVLYRNLEAHGIDTPEMVKLRGVYKHAWANNQIQLHLITPLIAVLEQAEIPTLVLKGLALAIGHYHDIGLRATGDGDLLIPLSQRESAISVLEANGFHIAAQVPRSRLAWLHATELYNAAGKKVDLHWHMTWESVGSALDDALWAAAIPLVLSEQHTRMLCPADQTLHVLIHGGWWNIAPSFRWVADALTVIRGGGIDWDRLVEGAQARQVTRTLAPMLRLLVDTFDAPIPQDVIVRVERARAARWQRIEYALKRRQRRVWHGVMYHPVKYGRVALNRRLSAFGFAAYLRDWWGIGSVRALPAHGLRQLRRSRES